LVAWFYNSFEKIDFNEMNQEVSNNFLRVETAKAIE